MIVSCANFMRLSVQEVVDMLLDQDNNCALCRGTVDGVRYDS